MKNKISFICELQIRRAEANRLASAKKQLEETQMRAPFVLKYERKMCRTTTNGE